MPRKPKAGLTKKSSRKSAKTQKKAQRKQGVKSLSTANRGRLSAAEKKALGEGLEGKKDVSTPAKYRKRVEELGQKGYSVKSRKKAIPKAKKRASKPRKPKGMR
jgi:hypothetical protein